jgi:hypothetical protein
MANSEKSAWDKAEIILQPVGGLLTALAVALVGILGSNYLNKSQEQDQKIRLYTELMSKREQSDTALREEMFKSMVATFLTPSTGKPEHKLLALELLAYNFHESLELAPLFKHVRREVEESSEKVSQKAEYHRRLESVAKEVAGKQVEILQESGTSGESGIDLLDLQAHPEGLRIFENCFPLHAEDLSKAAHKAAQPSSDAKPPATPRCVRVDVMEMDPKTQGLRIHLVSTTPEGENVDQLFWLDFYDLPMVDNTRLSHDQRYAVVLRRITDTGAQLAYVYFPGTHAGLKDKPFYDDMLHQLNLEPESGEPPSPQ